MPETLTRSVTEVYSNTYEQCEDCPDANVHPPEQSECPWFDNSGPQPVCTHPDSFESQMNNFGGGPDGPTWIGALVTGSEVITPVTIRQT